MELTGGAAAVFDERRDEEAVPSPCVGVCILDSQGSCEGCLRTGAEIAAWPSMSGDVQTALLETLALRWAERGL